MDNLVWTEKYRPKKIEDTILPAAMKAKFQQFVDTESFPNLLLCGKPGTGKTTVARAMCEEIDADYLIINASKDRNIDTLRMEISQFVSSMSFKGKRKVVILDEADYLNQQSTQPALRNFMEEFSENAVFVLTCNIRERIMDALQSRCSVIDFQVARDERPKLAAKFFKRACHILDSENVPYDKKVLAKLVEKRFPDLRRAVNDLQFYSATGAIDEGILIDKGGEFKALFEAMKAKKFTEVRKWLGENDDIEGAHFYRALYDDLVPKLGDQQSVAIAILYAADYEYKEAFVSNVVVNRAACLLQIMSEVSWSS